MEPDAFAVVDGVPLLARRAFLSAPRGAFRRGGRPRGGEAGDVAAGDAVIPGRAAHAGEEQPAATVELDHRSGDLRFRLGRDAEALDVAAPQLPHQVQIGGVGGERHLVIVRHVGRRAALLDRPDGDLRPAQRERRLAGTPGRRLRQADRHAQPERDRFDRLVRHRDRDQRPGRRRFTGEALPVDRQRRIGARFGDGRLRHQRKRPQMPGAAQSRTGEAGPFGDGKRRHGLRLVGFPARLLLRAGRAGKGQAEKDKRREASRPRRMSSPPRRMKKTVAFVVQSLSSGSGWRNHCPKLYR